MSEPTVRGVPDDLDPALTAWLDAARAGGLPGPSRDDRWQPLRAGVVSLWEFEAAEYWYAQGWVQLTGRNETGKSSLMALTTLIPWLADTSSANIDTLGRSGKKFRYYVEPTGNDGDRRPADASTNRGWVWVEYGRLVGGEPRFFTTLLFAETRTASSQVGLVWCTADGPRVRGELDLAPGRLVAHPKEVSVRGFLPHPTAGAYKQYVAENLLGSTPDRLEAAGKMLRVTRTPKLGAQLEIGFVREQLRLALPELDRGEVDALAAGWDQLDRIRADLAATKTAGDDLERFRQRAWLPWVRAEVRRRADAAARARTEFDRVTKDERDALAKVGQFEEEAQRVGAEQEEARRAADAARAAAEELQGSTRYQDARERLTTLERRRRDADDLTRQRAARASDVERAAALVAEADTEVRARAGRRADAHRLLDATRDALAAAAGAARVPVGAGEPDLPLFGQRLQERKGAIDRARSLLRASEEADRGASRAEDLAADKDGRARADRTAADQAWAQAEAGREALVRAVVDWAATLASPPAAAETDGWLAALPTQADEGGHVPGPPLRERVREEWFVPRHRALDRQEQDAERLRAEAQARADDLTGRIEALRAAPVPDFPPPVAWVRRGRPDASGAGAPLWALVDPRPGVAPGELARVEAALAALGLLDAWVTPDGRYAPERDGDDVVVSTGSTPDAAGAVTLADLLQPATGDEALAAHVSALLARVRVVAAAEALPDAGLAVGRDGRWRGDATVGRAAPRHPEADWIGESARAAQRRRTIEEWTQQREAAWEEARAAASGARIAREAIAGLTAAFDRCPGDEPLRSLLARADERDRTARRSAGEAAEAQARAADLRTAADNAVAALHAFCGERELPPDAAGLDAAVDAVAEAQQRARDVGGAREALAAAVAEQEAALARRADRVAERDLRRGRLEEITGQLAELRATLRALEATLDASDQAIVDELERLRAEARREADRHDALAVRSLHLQGALGEARATRAGAEQRRIEATGSRDAAFAEFRAVVDRGLPTEAGLDLPDVLSSAVDRVREQVAEARRRLTPPGWPDDADRQRAHVQRLAGQLTQAAHEVRQLLEAGGRSLRVVHDEAGLPRVEVVLDATGRALPPLEASARLAQIHADLDAAYNRRVQETLDELLGSAFLEHLRAQVGATDALIAHINHVLADHATVTSSTSLRILLQPAGDQDRLLLEALRGSSLTNPEVAAQVREHLRARVEEAKRLAVSSGEADWRERLADTLDYRRWFGVHLQKRIGSQGRWTPLTSQSFAEMSGGARAVTLMLPLVATLAALYEDMDGAPRPLWLDEAFDGLDAANRAMIMDLFRRFDLDVLLAGPARLVNVRTVPAAAIYQVVRAPAPLPGADLTLELWAGRDLIVVDLPITLPTGPVAPPAEQDALL